MSADSPELASGLPKTAHDALYSMYATGLADKIKVIEKNLDPLVPNDKPYVIRLDGVAFSTFTKGIVKPFDVRLTEAMVNTTVDLVQRFNPVLGYTQSDEISLVFPATPVSDSVIPEEDEDKVDETEGGEGGSNKRRHKASSKLKKSHNVQPQQHMYNGRLQKLASVPASYAAARLNYHLSRANWDDLKEPVRERMLGGAAFFDGRVVSIPDTETAMECIFWRSNFDGFRNCISTIGNAYFSPKEMHKKGMKEQLQMLATKNVSPFRDFAPRHLYGTWVKRAQFTLHGFVNPKTGKPVGPVLRTRVVIGSFNWADYTPEQRVSFTFAKLWPDDGPPKDAIPEKPSANS
ncbi:tRNAHis guanylyltransferase-domain-containing protein [Fimicolochytrium jonesii]|uniref:tRNAHis guanylyltransferase-domain-containing protein n=1 Tax=Fimicolochytrium jonesii TaxID=1396493 RepID=UPI0022FE084C|nr:tRNAHis guanylyltransferase-domain-containing protein [Fimicolochytrium jonesii]KAI8825019.1 tRNAHis guanylyltransferase-domain-containing protein [Fimicolochytrium jonesii]